MDEKMPEKRKYFRVMLSLQISYTVVGGPEEQKELHTKDISGGGMRLLLEEELPVGTLLKVTFELLMGQEKIELDAKVIWLNHIPDDAIYPYEAGIEFINVDVATRIKISNCVLYKAELLKEFYR